MIYTVDYEDESCRRAPSSASHAARRGPQHRPELLEVSGARVRSLTGGRALGDDEVLGAAPIVLANSSWNHTSSCSMCWRHLSYLPSPGSSRSSCPTRRAQLLFLLRLGPGSGTPMAAAF